MAKQSQPKVSEMIEVLIQQHQKSDSINNQISESLVTLVDLIKHTQLKVDVSELQRIEKENCEKRYTDFEIFHRETRKNNNELLKVHKVVSSKRMLYVILLNVFLLLVTGLSMYVAINNSIEKSEFESQVEQQKELKVQIENLDRFFSENPKAFSQYKKWLTQGKK